MLLKILFIIFIATASAKFVEDRKNLGNLVREVYGKGSNDIKTGNIDNKGTLNKVNISIYVVILMNVISDYLQPCNRGSGKCVPFYLCVGKRAGEKKSMLLDFRFTELCVNDMEVCCTTEDILADPNAPVAKSSGLRNFGAFQWQYFITFLYLIFRV